MELDGEQSRYIDYGYAVETAQQASVDRILVTGNSNQIAEQREALTHLSPHLRDLAIYTSDDSGLAVQQIASSASSSQSLSQPCRRLNWREWASACNCPAVYFNLSTRMMTRLTTEGRLKSVWSLLAPCGFHLWTISFQEGIKG